MRLIQLIHPVQLFQLIQLAQLAQLFQDVQVDRRSDVKSLWARDLLTNITLGRIYTQNGESLSMTWIINIVDGKCSVHKHL